MPVQLNQPGQTASIPLTSPIEKVKMRWTATQVARVARYLDL